MERQLLEAVYERYYRELYLYLYSLCRRRDMAEDVLQETYLKAFVALKDSHTNMRAWLYLTARNLCYNCMKKEKRMILAEDPWEQRADAAEDVLTDILRDEEKKELWRALEILPNPGREILLLQYFGGFGQREIAAMLRLTPANVRVLAHRAKQELRKKIGGEKYDIS